jgi:ABC-type Fe3+-siderophore transport system permease subunit
MTAFLLVTAAVAVVMGLVGLVAGHARRTTGRPRGPRTGVTR